jgi:hypothetical protein
MAGYPPPYPPPGPPPGQDWRYQRRILKEQARAQRDIARAQRDAYRAQYRGLRRSSIVGPLLLIAVGVVFLLIQTGRLNGFNFWTWYGRWWPLLLVGIGVILLIEWVFDRNAQNNVAPGSNVPYIRHSIGGGVVLLLILLVIAGISYTGYDHFGHGHNMPGFLFNPNNIDEFFGDKHESDQTIDQAFPTTASFDVNNPRGDVTISGTSDDNQIHIAVHKQVYVRSDSDADNRAKQLSPQISTSADTFNVNVPSLEGAIADLTITLPAGAAVTVTANHGDVRVSSVKAPVNITANHGDVELSAITGPVTTHINNNGASFSAHSITGSVTLEGHARDLTIADIDGPLSLSGDFFGDTHLERIHGPVKFHTSRTDFQLARLDGSLDVSAGQITGGEAQGPVTLTTRSRNITLQRISGDLAVSNSNGSVDLSSAPPLGNVTVENRRGSVNLTVPTKAAFTVQAQTTDGDIENDFDIPTQQNNSRKNFVGTVGKGGSVIRINTSDGDISLKKADLPPLPPSPPKQPITMDSHGLDIHDENGSSVYVGKDGVRIVSGSDGSRVIVDRNGLKISKGSDGSSDYRSPDGTRLNRNSDGSMSYHAANGTSLTKNVDGSMSYHGADGTRYTKNADDSITYLGPDSTHITINADGTKSGVGPSNKPLTDSQIRDQLRHADDEVRKTQEQIENVEQQRDRDLERKQENR